MIGGNYTIFSILPMLGWLDWGGYLLRILAELFQDGCTARLLWDFPPRWGFGSQVCLLLLCTSLVWSSNNLDLFRTLSKMLLLACWGFDPSTVYYYFFCHWLVGEHSSPILEGFWFYNTDYKVCTRDSSTSWWSKTPIGTYIYTNFHKILTTST